MLWDEAHTHTLPEYNNPPEGYDALYVQGPEIYVIPNTQQVYPILYGIVNDTTFTK